MITKKISASKELWEKIKNLREQNWKFSQEQISKLLWISRVSLSNIENWERDIKNEELETICEIFEVPKNSLVWDDYISDIKPLSKEDKNYNFKRILLYILNKVANKPNVWKTVLYKLLYFSEFNFYEINWDTLLWVDFMKWPRWPVPIWADEIFEEMEKDNQIQLKVTSFKWYEQHKIIPLLDEVDLSDLSYNDVKVIDDVIEKLSSMKAVEISEYSHEDMPYKATKNIWDTINKRLVFYRTVKYSVTDN